MNHKLAGAFAALIVLAVPRIAAAADFFLIAVNMDTDKDDPTAMVLDPASIVVESDGNKTFRYATVHDVGSGVVSEFIMEADCSASRWRQIDFKYTAIEGDVTEDTAVKDWEALQDGSNGAYMYKTVCDYPNNQPTGDIIQASDYQAMLQTAAEDLTEMKAEGN
jgi:hypothetical protein